MSVHHCWVTFIWKKKLQVRKWHGLETLQENSLDIFSMLWPKKISPQDTKKNFLRKNFCPLFRWELTSSTRFRVATSMRWKFIIPTRTCRVCSLLRFDGKKWCFLAFPTVQAHCRSPTGRSSTGSNTRRPYKWLGRRMQRAKMGVICTSDEVTIAIAMQPAARTWRRRVISRACTCLCLACMAVSASPPSNHGQRGIGWSVAPRRKCMCRAALGLKKFARADHHDILEKFIFSRISWWSARANFFRPSAALHTHFLRGTTLHPPLTVLQPQKNEASFHTYSIGSQVRRSTDERIRFLLLFYSWNHISTCLCPYQTQEPSLNMHLPLPSSASVQRLSEAFLPHKTYWRKIWRGPLPQ